MAEKYLVVTAVGADRPGLVAELGLQLRIRETGSPVPAGKMSRDALRRQLHGRRDAE
jgi:glycine cleavage system regulatory protein